MHPRLELPLLFQHLPTPAHNCLLNCLIQHVNALAEPKDVDASVKVTAIGCCEGESGAYAQPLLFKAGHGLNDFWCFGDSYIPPRYRHNTLQETEMVGNIERVKQGCCGQNCPGV